MQKKDNNAALKKENAQPYLLKRIGSTVYHVTVHFSETSKETMEDKILRLIEREVRDSA